MPPLFTAGIKSLRSNGFKNTGIKVLRYFLSRTAWFSFLNLFGSGGSGGIRPGGGQNTARIEVFSIYSESVNCSYPHPEALAIGRISDSLLRDMNDAIETGVISKRKPSELDSEGLDHLFLLTDVGAHSKETKELLDQNLTVLDLHKFDSSHMLIGNLHSEIRVLFHAEVGSPFVFVNTRMWISHPMGDRFGPNAFHKDGLDKGHLKVMVYLSPSDSECGYLEVKKGAKNMKIIDKPSGLAVLFRNSDLEHSGVPGTKFPRISIEVTLMRSHINAPQAWAGHYYGRNLIDPTIFHHSNEAYLNESRIGPADLAVEDHGAGKSENSVQDKWYIADVNRGLKANIGSGVRNWDGWVCLDEIKGSGVTNVTFDPNVSLPLPDNSTSLIYSSHCFEHLDLQTLFGITRELRRVAMPRALFILKIPDYEYFLRQYRKGVYTTMDNKGVESVVHTWKGVMENNFINRLSMMFCSYWNQAYGDHFSGNIKNLSHAYHGPAKLPLRELETIFNSDSPGQIAQDLRTFALKDPDFKRFNHQSAWSRREMNELLDNEGFKVLSNCSPVIIKKFRELIPDLRLMESWSAYYLAEIKQRT